jgi:cytochrome c oxidase subunit III
VTSVAAGTSTRTAARPLTAGVVIWLASELMFFGGLFAAYFTLRSANATWPSAGVELDVPRAAVFTVVLVVSSGTMHLAHRAAEADDRATAVRWLAGTILLGTVFLINQLLEYNNLDFSLDTDAYGSIFYLLTGFHALHVLAGLALMVAVGWLITPSGPGPDAADHVRVTGYYWHFVDVVWVVVFFAVYVLQ